MQRSILSFAFVLLTLASQSFADPAFKLGGTTYSVDDVAKDNQGRFFDLEQKKYEALSEVAHERYIESYFRNLAAQAKVSVEKARETFLESKTRPTASELKQAIEQFKDHPSLRELSESDRTQSITNYLRQNKAREVFQTIISEGLAKKELVILYPEPKEPIYQLSVSPGDHVRYGADGKDAAASGCKDEECPITIVEYSEFQCPFCEKTQPATQQILKEFKGKIRWITRDFPLPSHKRAKPAAVAAHCAGEQGKYWEMYAELFKNQRGLEDKDLQKYGKAIGLDSKAFAACLQKPERPLAKIDANLQSGEKFGVTGTPTFFINGRRLSGALPYAEFKKVIVATQGK